MKPVEITLAEFLETLDAQLGDLPPARRIEIIGETRDHLEAMIAARRADGMDENEAWRSARNAFGDAEATGRELAREWKRAPRVETVGTPLSGREKALNIVRILGGVLAFFLAISALMPWLEARQLVGTFFLVLTPLMIVFNIWRHHRKKMPWTPTAIAGLLFGFLISMTMALKIQFASELRGTPFETAFNTYFSPVMLVGCLGMVWWVKREERKTLPWRYLPRYASNPIGAEEEYRLSPLLGLIAGTMMGCISSISMGLRFYGLPIALFNCLLLIILAWFYARFVINKSR